MTLVGVDIALDVFWVQRMVRSFAQWNVSTILMSFILISLYHYQAGSSQLTVYSELGCTCSILFCFYLFTSLLTWFFHIFFSRPNMCWAGKELTTATAIVQCPGFSSVSRFRCCWVFWIHTISYCHTGVPVGIGYAFVLQVCVKWEVGISFVCLSP